MESGLFTSASAVDSLFWMPKFSARRSTFAAFAPLAAVKTVPSVPHHSRA
jgi:hypothetical protein